MANYSITPRKGKYTCQVRWVSERSLNKEGRTSKSRTFSSRNAAIAWGEKQVLEIENGAGDTEKVKTLKLGALLDNYLNDPLVNIGRSKRYSLNLIRDSDISETPCNKLKAKDIVDFCKDRISTGVTPATIACDVSHLRSVLKNAEALYDIPVDETPIVKAMPTLHSLNLVGKAQIRSRRPTEIETEKLRAGLKAREKHRSSFVPFVDIHDFSILTCMRVGEVCKILWEDLNEEESWVLLRDRKDPRKKIGNHMKVPLLGGALEIVQRQPKTDDPRIFPFNSTSVTTGFRRTRDKLGIKDLRYHDLRREGASRLFEKGYDITEVAQVTGHRDLNTLWRIYTDLQPNRLTD